MKIKKTIYIILSVFLGILLSFVVHALLELAIINSALSQGRIIKATYFFGIGWCALPVWTQYTFPILGIAGGYFLGQTWWRLVYVEKRHWRFQKNNKRKKK